MVHHRHAYGTSIGRRNINGSGIKLRVRSQSHTKGHIAKVYLKVMSQGHLKIIISEVISMVQNIQGSFPKVHFKRFVIKFRKFKIKCERVKRK